MEFLILAVALIAVGVLIVLLRNRRPTGIDAGIDDFAARRQALAPPTSAAASHGVAGLARDLAIDLGTANTLVYSRGQGIILNEPTVIALNSRSQDVLAMGHEAWQMIGRTPGYIVAVRPLRGGAITDFEITQRMIRLLFQRAGVSRLYRARVLDLRPVGDHARRAARGARGRAARRRGRDLSHRAADGRGDRRRPADPRADRQHGRRRRRRHHRGRGDLARRRRRARGGARRLVRHRRRDPGLRAARVRHRDRRAHRRRRSSSRSAPRSRRPTSTRPRCAAATS